MLNVYVLVFIIISSIDYIHVTDAYNTVIVLSLLLLCFMYK